MLCMFMRVMPSQGLLHATGLALMTYHNHKDDFRKLQVRGLTHGSGGWPVTVVVIDVRLRRLLRGGDDDFCKLQGGTRDGRVEHVRSQHGRDQHMIGRCSCLNLLMVRLLACCVQGDVKAGVLIALARLVNSSKHLVIVPSPRYRYGFP